MDSVRDGTTKMHGPQTLTISPRRVAGGKVEAGETVLEGARRELNEVCF